MLAALCILGLAGMGSLMASDEAAQDCCGAPVPAGRERQGVSAGARPGPQLQALERAAIQRVGVRREEVKPEDYQRIVKAARDYAAAVAGEDNAKFTRLASSALQQGLAVEMGFGDQAEAMRSIAPIAPQGAAALDLRNTMPLSRESSVWENPQFQKNLRDLLDRAAKPDSDLVPIVGPPSPTARIVGYGSREALPDEFPDCVCVGRRIGNVDQYCCTGTLVGRNVVVTAGHCFFCGGAGANAVVFVGNNITQSGETYTGTIHRHPEYNQGGLSNDLAVIVLDEDVDGVAPRPMATTEQADQTTFVRAAGFGNSDFASTTGFGIKRLVDVPIASTACARPNDPSNLGCDAQLELVAGFVGLGPDSCNGDSGGPVYLLVGNDARDPDAWRVCGATSRATSAATRPCGDGGIYIRLDKYLTFIRNVPGARF